MKKGSKTREPCSVQLYPQKSQESRFAERGEGKKCRKGQEEEISEFWRRSRH